MPEQDRLTIDRYTGIGFGVALSTTRGGDPWRWELRLLLPTVILRFRFGRRPADPWGPEVRRG